MVFLYFRQLIILYFHIDFYDYETSRTFLLWICNLDLIDPDASKKSPISNPLINLVIIPSQVRPTQTGNEVAVMLLDHRNTGAHLNGKQMYVY